MGRKKAKKQQSGLDDLFNDHFFDDEPDEELDESSDGEPSAEGEGGMARKGVETIRLSLVEPNPDQPRKEFDEEKISELADSIRQHGILQPLLVRPLSNGGYQIVAGERRWRAARVAELTEVPAVIRELDDKQVAQFALIENLQREDLNPIDEAMGYQSLMDNYGMTQQEVADVVGKPRSSIANSLRLLSLDVDVRNMLINGVISTGHAKLLAPLDEKRQLELADLTSTEQLSVKQLSDLIEAQKKMKKASPKPRLKKPTFLVEAELALKQTFGQPVKVEQAKGGKTKLTIECKNEEAFRELMKKLTESQS